MNERTKNVLIAILFIVIITQGLGLVYLGTMVPNVGPDNEVSLTVGTTLPIGRVIHPQYVQGGDDPITNEIFEGLFGYINNTLQIEPVLATDFGIVSENGLEYTFNLQQGVFFHDGTQFNASCVKWHFDLMFDLGFGMTYMFVDGLLNKTEVVDTYTVKFTLNYPNSNFFDMLCFITAMIPSPTAAEKYGLDNLNDHPVGTGPFKFVSKIIDNEVVMEANQDWWRLGPSDHIAIDNLVFVMISDPGTLKLAIENGDIDATDGRYNVNDYASLIANPDLTTIDVSGSSSRRWLTFNMNASVWDTFSIKEARQAFAYAIPYDQIINVALNGYGERQYSFLPSDYVGYKEVFHYDYNATKALELLDDAGFSPPISVNLHITPTYYGLTEPDVAAVIKEYAEDAGFDVTIIQEEYAAYKTSYKTTANQEMNLWAWSANYPSTGEWATQFMSSVGWGTGYSMVTSGDMAPLYPHVDEIIQEAAGTTNTTRKVEILEELQDLWAEWVPNIFVWRETKYQFVRAGIQGIVYGSLMWDIHFEHAVIS